MAKKSVLDLTIAAPWPVGLVLGALGYATCAWLLPPILASTDNIFLKSIGANRDMLRHIGLAVLAVFWLGAAASFLVRTLRSRGDARTARRQPGFAATIAELEPACPKCGQVMVMRTARSSGERIWGCSAFPKCRGTLPLGT